MNKGKGSGDDAAQEPVAPSASIEERLAQAMAELEATQEAVAKAETELRDASFTVRSRDRAVEVTVGHQGELTALRFLEGKYRNMSAGELAGSVLEAAERARTQMSRHVMETFQPFTQPSATAPELTGVDIDWAAIFGPSVQEEPQAVAGRHTRNRLRDEIGEDTEDEHDV
ncbi:YbaB/EbfC family nucleoid-associated protein [Streptomyces canus]|uniref:YbaB/EbfC family nucleoid-associated protein n=1 Tax=Streptomyces canus TaxID=58343 RepID=UPI0027885B04|nr:YbaB/EbfC family nucleoid-associated protein [Streptomyces canus]MDQ0765443.1 DNA-binding protein YbaB [Streptomyces canus]